MNKSNMEKKSLKRSIVLIGMMGAGKTTLGIEVARRLDASFVDSDKEIEAREGCSVAALFASRGEAEFRRMEREVIETLLEGKEACVLSLGGGAFMNEETRRRIRNDSFSVWIKVDKRFLLQRLTQDRSRPLLQGNEPEAAFEKILAEREPVYALADLAVLCDDSPASENAEKIIRHLIAAGVCAK